MNRWKLLLVALGMGIGLWTTPSAAQTVLKTGRITRVDVFGAGNYAFRIYLSNPAPECGDGFLFVDTSDPNFAGYTAGLLTAASSGKSVVVGAVLQNGFCRIANYQILF